jgi:phosphoribosylamine---glycine ligase
MRFLGIGDTCDLNSLYLRLKADGHEVKVSVSEPMCHGVLAGLVEQVPDWQAELPWVREAGLDGIILFENVAQSRGALQDDLRRDGFHVIGGSAFGDRLENDRGFAQCVLAELGLPIAATHSFEEPAAAIRFIEERPGRYVSKMNGPGYGAADNYVGRLRDGRDVRAFLAATARKLDGKPAGLVLMEHVEGVEMGVGAYFNGERFLRPACLDWEHKRFFPGDLGELTGEMGTVATYDRSDLFFDRTLARMEPLLRKNGYCGYINLNTIVNERGIWPLEFTCRFGYPGFAVLDPLQATSWADLFSSLIRRSAERFETVPGFSVGVVLTTRPFPYIRRYVDEPIGLPILFDGEVTEEDRRHLHFGEVGLEAGELVTAGYHGWTMVVTGVADTIPAAQAKAYALADRVVVPNLRYRRDIGDKLVAGDLARVERLGLFGADSNSLRGGEGRPGGPG